MPPPALQEEEEEPGAEELADGYASVASGLASSLPSGIETPAEVDLRKGKEGPRQLYSVLEQQKAAVGAGQLMGSDHTYVIPGAGGAGGEKKPLSIAAQVRRTARFLVISLACAGPRGCSATRGWPACMLLPGSWTAWAQRPACSFRQRCWAWRESWRCCWPSPATGHPRRRRSPPPPPPPSTGWRTSGCRSSIPQP